MRGSIRPTTKQALEAYFEHLVNDRRHKLSGVRSQRSVLIGSDRPGRKRQGGPPLAACYGSRKVDGLTVGELRGWFRDRCPVGASAEANARRSASALNGFVEFCQAQGWMGSHMTAALLRGLPRGQRNDHWLRPEQIIAFEDHVLPTGRIDEYRRLVWHTLLVTGIRTEELASVRLQNFDVHDGVLNVWGKGAGREGKHRKVPVPDDFVELLRTTGRNWGVRPQDPLFYARDWRFTGADTEGRWEVISIRRAASESGHRKTMKVISEEAERAVAEGRMSHDMLPTFELTPKVLRKSYACTQYILNARGHGGMSIQEISKSLGHEDLRTTEIYLADVHLYLNQVGERVSTSDAARRIVAGTEHERREKRRQQLDEMRRALQQMEDELDEPRLAS
jgi:integrase